MAGKRNGARSVPTYELLTAKIREQIISGSLQPGDRLPSEPLLAAHYKVSRLTAREALRSLANQGLLTTRRGVRGGSFVVVPQFEHVSESLQASLGMLAQHAYLPVSALVEIREILEAPAAQLAAARRTPEDLEALRSTLFNVRSDSPAVVARQSQEFHARIVRAAHNPLLVALTDPVFRVLQERFVTEQAPSELWRRVDREHRQIVHYLYERDQVGAREAMAVHLRATRVTYELIDRQPAT